MFLTNKKILRTFSSSITENCWAYIEGTGWRKIQTGSTDGVSNLYMIMNAARANDRLVHVNIDGTNRINFAYLK